MDFIKLVNLESDLYLGNLFLTALVSVMGTLVCQIISSPQFLTIGS